jgi:CheY-like chemotaxis protein/HPt (histidine-containing phosphotransfer) domain-containing protein
LVLMTDSAAGHSAGTRLRDLGFSAAVLQLISESRLLETLTLALDEKERKIAPSAGNVSQQTGASPAQKQARILVAEDDRTNQQVIVAILEKLGYRADVVKDGAEAVSAVQKAEYDLILMDCLMPEVDGYQATRRIRQQRAEAGKPAVPIIAVTADAMAGDRDNCFQAGMSDYLPKPIEPQQVASILEKWLATPAAGPQDRPSGVDSLSENEWVFNEADLLKRLMGDTSFARTLIAGFLSDAPRQLESLKNWIEQGDAARARVQAHTLKGAAASASANALSSASFKIQQAAASEDLSQAAALLPRLEAEYHRFEEAVRRSGWL